MAIVTVVNSLFGPQVPFAAMPAVTRLSGTTTTATLDAVNGSTLIMLTGSGLTYDGQALPMGGTITGLELRFNGVSTSWTATGFSVDAAAFRANAGTLDSFLFGGADTILGAGLVDHLFGYGGDDSIAGGDGGDGIVAGDGNDTVSPGLGTDGISLGEGDDLLFIGGAQNGGTKFANGGTGTDRLVAGGDISANNLQGFEELTWHSPDIEIRLTNVQLAGFDTLVLGSLSPGAERTELEITGGGFVDLGALALQTNGADSLAVALVGTTGTVIRGRDIADGAANDLIDANGNAADAIATFGGSDTITSASGGDTIAAGDGNDLVRIFGGNALVFLGDGHDSATGFDGAETIDGGLGNDTMTAGAGHDLLIGGDGADSIVGGPGNDTAYGGAGADTIAGGDGSDTILGGAGNDVIDVGSFFGATDSVLGGIGNDVITGGGTLGSVVFRGDDGADTITSSAFRSTIDGGAGNDVLTGSSQSQQVASLITFALDTILGGAGNDRITGGRGGDSLVGGTGADTFAYAPGDSGRITFGMLVDVDTIGGFSRAEGDRIDLSAIDADVLTDGDQAFDEVLPAASLTPITAGSLRYSVGASGTTIMGSTDNDADFELQILVTTAGYVPILSDFIL
ncbi:hypothetical protein KPL78_07290 [Roseomonas sp. HJA6]|uniref:Calcium-binding protein n=1 Tax=Roseomonas alba TaxID=2846776 RepID=A0ABS7A5V5_9PROT|nr:calcium-binding protein [Neoroseomonas alba]MBW6397641.1 hypothetical protein [Neoroseomonas alba]